jgi:hypothetical protein
MSPSLRSSQVRSPSGHASLLLQDSFQAEGPMGRATVLKSYWPCHAPCTGQRSSRGFAGHATLFLQNSSQIRGLLDITQFLCRAFFKLVVLRPCHAYLRDISSKVPHEPCYTPSTGQFSRKGLVDHFTLLVQDSFQVRVHWLCVGPSSGQFSNKRYSVHDRLLLEGVLKCVLLLAMSHS